jgi:hypothetical protein
MGSSFFPGIIMHHRAAEALSAENCLPSGHPVKGKSLRDSCAALDGVPGLREGIPACKALQNQLFQRFTFELKMVHLSTENGSVFNFK